MERLRRNFFSFLILGIACYAGLVFFGQGGDFWNALLNFPISYLPLLLALAFFNYLLRYFRWQIYLKALGVNLVSWKSFQIFMAGQAMTLTPAKSGEVLKGHLLKPETENAWSVALPAVFAERLTDLMGVVILASLGLSVIPVGRHAALLGMALCVVLFLVFSRPAFFKSFVRLLAKVPRLAERSEKLLGLYGNIQTLLSLRLLAEALFISVAAWFVEGLVLHFSLVACGSELNIIQSTFVYSLSSLVGALSMLPGGLIVTEGSMSGMLCLFGVKLNRGALVTLIVRLCTLWFAVFAGMAFLFFLQRRQALKLQSASERIR